MYKAMLLHTLLGWWEAHTPHLLLVAVLEGGEVLQELHAETAPLFSLLVPASTEGWEKEGYGGLFLHSKAFVVSAGANTLCC